MTRHVETERAEGVLPTQATGGRMAADERRLQIAQVAMRLFSERGFRGTTTKEIAQAAGVSEAIIFRHFATKEELYTAIIDYKGCAGLGASPVAREAEQPAFVEKLCAFAGEAVEARDDRAVFRGVALSMLEHHQSDPDFLRLLMYLALENHSLAQIFWDKNVRVLYEFLGGYVRRRQREGAFRDVDPNTAVRVFLGTIIHHSLSNLLWDKDPARRILNMSNEEAAREFAEILLRGIKADPGDAHNAPAAKREETTKRAAETTKRAANARNREGVADVKSNDHKHKKK
jgi:AcrR family transcriptional regulator